MVPPLAVLTQWVLGLISLRPARLLTCRMVCCLIEPENFNRHSIIQGRLVVCHHTRNGPASSEVTDALRGAEQRLRQRYSDPEALKTDPTIMSWQEAHRRFGSNPNKFPCSIHALAKRVLKGGQLPSISALVDLYNVVSLRHFLPAGWSLRQQRCRIISITYSEGAHGHPGRKYLKIKRHYMHS